MNKFELLEIIRNTAPAVIVHSVEEILRRERELAVMRYELKSKVRDLMGTVRVTGKPVAPLFDDNHKYQQIVEACEVR